jgi:hypothetical protein
MARRFALLAASTCIDGPALEYDGWSSYQSSS